jgi:hypothetical protein
MQFSFGAAPCPDKGGQDIAADPQLASMIRLARVRSLHAYKLRKELKKRWVYVQNRYDLELGEATSLQQAWLVNLAWLLFRQHVGELRLTYQSPTVPFAVAGGEELTEADTVRLHVVAFAIAIVSDMAERAAYKTDPFHAAGMELGQTTCQHFDSAYKLETMPQAGIGVEFVRRLAGGGPSKNIERWMANLLVLSAQYAAAGSQKHTGHDRPQIRRTR